MFSTTTPLILGHRGSAAGAVENSIPAFELATAPGVSGVELDVQRARDGQVVVFHDRDLLRLNGEAVPVASLPAAELATRELQVVRPDGTRHHAPGVPSLHAVIDVLRPDQVIDIELKHHDGAVPGLGAAVAAVIADRALQGRVLVSSFDPRLVWEFRRAARSRRLKVPTAVIYSRDPEVPPALRRGMGVPLTGSAVAKPQWDVLIDRGHPGRFAIPWTINDEDTVRKIVAATSRRRCRVVGFIGDDPIGLRGWVEAALREAAARSA